MTAPARLLVIGLDNDFRHDDGAGRLAARRVRELAGNAVRVIEESGEGATRDWFEAAVDRVRHRGKGFHLVTIGACATAGGIQALRNFKDVRKFTSIVYATPDYIETLRTSTPIADHVFVDFELRGCPVNKQQLIEVISAFLHGRKPNTPPHSVCTECKRRGIVCVMVARGTPCLGPVTHGGCGALCHAYHRGCYGCFGPKETPNTPSLSGWMQDKLGVSNPDLVRASRTFNAAAEPFRRESEAREPD